GRGGGGRGLGAGGDRKGQGQGQAGPCGFRPAGGRIAPAVKGGGRSNPQGAGHAQDKRFSPTEVYPPCPPADVHTPGLSARRIDLSSLATEGAPDGRSSLRPTPATDRAVRRRRARATRRL